jgi:hypothetical protein
MQNPPEVGFLPACFGGGVFSALDAPKPAAVAMPGRRLSLKISTFKRYGGGPDLSRRPNFFHESTKQEEIVRHLRISRRVLSRKEKPRR